MDGGANLMIMKSLPFKYCRYFQLVVGEVLWVEDKEKWHFFIVSLDIKGAQSIEADVVVAHTEDEWD